MSETSINNSVSLTTEILHEKMLPEYLHLPTLLEAKEEANLFALRFPPKKGSKRHHSYRNRRPQQGRHRRRSKYDFPQIVEFAVDGTHINGKC